MKLKPITSPIDELIVVKTSRDELDRRLRVQLEQGVIGGEQWFRNYDFWYGTPAYANPYKTPFEELPLLTREKDNLRRYLAKTLKVYYGLGIGDSEIIPVLWDLEEEGYAEVYAIDVIKDFIDNFIQGLRNLVRSPELLSSKIRFLGNNTLFEKLTPDDFRLEHNKYNKYTHICFGNTIGNFEQNEIFSIFERTVEEGDYLLLGYQLNIGKRAILEQYKGNFRFERLIKALIGKAKDLADKEVVWEYNDKTNYVEARVDNILIFRSKKYNQSELERNARNYGFQVVRSIMKRMSFQLRLVGISLFEKVSR